MLVMDIVPTSTSPLSTTPKSREPESETPIRIQPNIKPVSFTNGVLKRHHRRHHHDHHHVPAVVITYRECLKNHAAALGGHALDGCGEFMPSPSASPTDPTSLKCAACGCHRNFHRREPEDPLPTTTATATIEYQPHNRHHPPPPPPTASHPHRSPNSASPPPISSSYYPSAPHMLLALSGGLTGALDNTHNNYHLPAAALTPNTKNLGSNSKKRFRTKFTQLQKDKMLEFAERIGWKIQKRDEEIIQEFCNEVGIDRGVLKVWMHNNKNTFGKKDQANGGSSEGTESRNNNNNNIDSTGLNHEDNNNNKGQNLNHHFETHSVAPVGTNGSSSSS